MPEYRINVNKPDPPDHLGINVYQPDRCWPGYTLCWSRQQESARLVTMDGRIAHRWTYTQGIPWHFTEMLPDGHLLVVANKGQWKSLFELDWEGNVVWRTITRAHHDAERLANGNTLAVCHSYAHYPALSDHPLLYDYLEEITPDHQVAWQWHFAAHVDEIDAEIPLRPAERNKDWPHLNTVEVLPDTPLGRRDTRFRAGNVMISPRHLHMVIVIDRQTGQIVWHWGRGELLGQHHPTMLANGNILVFDNGQGPPMRGSSRVIELHPPDGEMVWTYEADPPMDFWSPVGSGNQRLPNGNTLICAMNWGQVGRVFEVTPGGEIVWEFWDPEQDVFYRATRYAPEIVEPFLQQ